MSLKRDELPGRQCLVFAVADQEYAVPLDRVKSVTSFGSAVPIPWMPTHYIGLVNLRGEIVLVIDLAKKLGVSRTHAAAEPSVIVINTQPKAKGVLVDMIKRVDRLEDGFLELDPLLEGPAA